MQKQQQQSVCKYFFHTWGSGLEMGQGIVIPQRSTSDLAWQVLPNLRPESNLCSETIALSVSSMTPYKPPGRIKILALLCRLLFSDWAMMQMTGTVRWGWGDVCDNVTFENNHTWYKPEPTQNSTVMLKVCRHISINPESAENRVAVVATGEKRKKKKLRT